MDASFWQRFPGAVALCMGIALLAACGAETPSEAPGVTLAPVSTAAARASTDPAADAYLALVDECNAENDALDDDLAAASSRDEAISLLTRFAEHEAECWIGGFEEISFPDAVEAEASAWMAARTAFHESLVVLAEAQTDDEYFDLLRDLEHRIDAIIAASDELRSALGVPPVENPANGGN